MEECFFLYNEQGGAEGETHTGNRANLGREGDAETRRGEKRLPVVFDVKRTTCATYVETKSTQNTTVLTHKSSANAHITPAGLASRAAGCP